MPLVIYWTGSAAYIGTEFNRAIGVGRHRFVLIFITVLDLGVTLVIYFLAKYLYKFFIRLQLQHSCQNIDWTNHVLTVFLILALTADWTTCRRDRKVSEKRDLFTLSSNAWALWWFAVCLSTVCTSWGSYQLSCSVTIGPLQVRDSDGGMLLMP